MTLDRRVGVSGVVVFDRALGPDPVTRNTIAFLPVNQSQSLDQAIKRADRIVSLVQREGSDS